jgi:site-specific recombinase XerC
MARVKGVILKTIEKNSISQPEVQRKFLNTGATRPIQKERCLHTYLRYSFAPPLLESGTDFRFAGEREKRTGKVEGNQ